MGRQSDPRVAAALVVLVVGIMLAVIVAVLLYARLRHGA